jgi:hypothetical protein
MRAFRKSSAAGVQTTTLGKPRQLQANFGFRRTGMGRKSWLFASAAPMLAESPASLLAAGD